MNKEKVLQSEIVKGLKNTVKVLEATRTNKDNPVDLGFFEHFKMSDPEKYDSAEAVLSDMGIDPQVDTIHNLTTMPETDLTWVVPEIVRSAINLGIRKSAIWPKLVAADETVSQTKVVMPHVNMSDAAPKRVNEGATIPLGQVSYGQRDISIWKMGRGFKMTDEVVRYVSLNLLSIFLRDFGLKLGIALDTLAIRTALNGDQPNGINSAPVIGVATANTLAYKDLLKLCVRGSRLGRSYGNMIAGETMAIDMLDMDEFKLRYAGSTTATLNIQTPIPNSANLFIHGTMPDNQVMAIDKSVGLIRLTAVPLMVESERIVSNQTQATYATITTGFGKLFDDSVVVIDKSLAFSGAGFPAFMEVNDLEVEEITMD